LIVYAFSSHSRHFLLVSHRFLFARDAQAILTQLLPSLKRVVSSCFFAEGVNNLHASPSVSASLFLLLTCTRTVLIFLSDLYALVSIQYVFKTITPRLTKLLKDKQGE
jgi:hypothetical protein